MPDAPEPAVLRPLTILELVKEKAQDLRHAQARVVALKTEIAAIKKGIAAAVRGGAPARKPRTRPAKPTTVTPSRRRGMPKAAKAEPVIEG